MDIVSKIKESVTSSVLENFNSFLGENTSNVESALGLSLNTFLAGLLRYGQTEIETKKIINILNDGGHSGDILNNLENFSGNFEKTQLLVTIGNNIVSHFLGVKSNSLIDKISDITDVKKTSASSLLSIAGPIVLGFIGKEVRVKNLDEKGLSEYFAGINDSVINALPPAVINIFQFKKQTTESNKTQSSKKIGENKAVKPSKNNWSLALPWIILLLAGIGAAVYHIKYKKSDILSDAIQIEEAKPSISENSPSDFLPENNNESKEDEKAISLKELEPKAVIEEPKEIKKEIKLVSPPLAEKQNILNASTKISQVAKSVPEISELKPSRLANGWSGISNSVYKRNSAEVTNSGALSNIVNQLSDRSKVIKIAPLSDGNASLNEDRAYALREKLIEKGVKIDQIEIVNTQKGSDLNGISFRIVD